MKTLRAALISIFVFLFFSGCGDDDAGPSYDIYVYGDTNQQAAYWKNGELNYLTDGTKPSTTTGGVFSGGDFYVAGMVATGPDWRAVYWKNGVQETFSDATGNENVGGIAVVGTDVYISGYEFRDGTIFAKYWKNGTTVYLNDGSSMCGATDILVVGNDVHVIGFETIPNGPVLPRYWKNGVLVDMPITTPSAQYNDIEASGSDIYIVGYTINENSQYTPTYWKNGVETVLTSGTIASRIAFAGTDVYILAGSEGLYWKNQEVHNLPTDGLDYVAPMGIAVAGNEIFVAANNLNTATFARLGGYVWKNDVGVSPFLGNSPGEELKGIVIAMH